MKNISKNKKYIIVAAFIGMITTSLIMTKPAFSDPGSQDDPLVTLSYVENRVNQIIYYIDEKIKTLTDLVEQNKVETAEIIEKIGDSNLNSNSLASSLEVVELKNGQRLICKNGTEIILRGGKAKVIASQLGGLCDVTGGKDLGMGQDVPANHLLIIPRDDGRGVYVEEYAIFMIRGEYEIR